MLYMVAPFESENIIKNISSRNIEILKKYNGDSELILSDFDHRYKKRNERKGISQYLSESGITHSYIDITSYKKNISIGRVISNISFAFGLYRFLKKKLKTGDKVYLNAIPPETLFAIFLLKKKIEIEVIVDVRDIWPDALINQNKRSLLVSAFSTYCNVLYKRATSAIDKYIYVAPSFSKWIARYNKHDKKALLSPLGYDKNRWVTNIKEESILLDKEKINLVYVGYLSNQFSLDKIIDYFNDNQSSDLIFHIIGGGDKLEFYKKRVKNNNIIFYGMQSPQFVSKNLPDFDIGILPLREGAASFLPNKFFDYIAAGLPIISYGSPDVGSLIEENNLGWYIDESSCHIESTFSSLDKQHFIAKNNSVRKYSKVSSMQYLNNEIVEVISK